MSRIRQAIQRLPRAFKAAFETFVLTMFGWEVASYARRVWLGYGRCVGSITRRQPTYPGWDEPRGWGFSSEGETWPETHGSPFQLLRKPSLAEITERRAAVARKSKPDFQTP